MRKWIQLLLPLVLVITGGCSNSPNANKESGLSGKIGLVTDTGGLNDESFNQTSWKGLTDLKAETGFDIKALESKRDEDYIPNLTKFAREPRNMTWGIGFKFEKAIPELATRFPNVRFGIVDSNLGGKVPSNVTALTFTDHEGSFIVGAIAALKTKTNKLGFVGGISSPLVKKFESGFRAGVNYVNPKVEVTVAYAESFTDETKGRSLASSMYNNGVDIIYHAAGGVGKGIFNEAKTREKGKFWVIGVDTDQSNLAPDHTLTSMVKKLDVAIQKISKEILNGANHSGKVIEYGLKEDGVGYPETTKKHVSKDILIKVNKFRDDVIKGLIKVPQTEEQLVKFLK